MDVVGLIRRAMLKGLTPRTVMFGVCVCKAHFCVFMHGLILWI